MVFSDRQHTLKGVYRHKWKNYDRITNGKNEIRQVIPYRILDNVSLIANLYSNNKKKVALPLICRMC